MTSIMEANEKKLEVKVGNEEEAYWQERKKASEETIKMHEEGLKIIPRHINFHKEIIKLCEEKLKDVVKVEV